MLAVSQRLFLSRPVDDGRLMLVGELPIGDAAGGAAGGRWYVSVDTGTDAGGIVALVPFAVPPSRRPE
jgi:hypothetical protein